MDATRSDIAETESETDVSAVIAADLLVEEVSIDGMCGVY